MMFSTGRICPLILELLAGGEKRVLQLVVAIRKELHRTELYKGDLPATVRSALRKLVADGAIFDSDGLYSLRRPRDPQHA